MPFLKNSFQNVLTIALFAAVPTLATAQIAPLPPPGSASNTQQLLAQKIGLELRDATLLEALFAIRDLTGLNVVVGNEVTGTVNASFSDTPVDKILDTLLVPRGYSYRVVSGSIAILPLEIVGDKLPSFQTAVVPLKTVQAADLQAIVQSLLSPEGRVHVVASSNSLLVMDYAERVADARTQIESLDVAAALHAKMHPTNLGSAAANSGSTSDADARYAVNNAVAVRVFAPQYVKATVLAEGIIPLLSEVGRASSLEFDDKLIVSDLPVNLDRIASALLEMDVPRPQVRVWAKIYDCDIQDLEACGINFSSGINGAGLTATGSPAHSAMVNAVTAPVTAGTNGVFSMSTINRLGSMNTIIQALESSDDSRLLADPNVVVMNHENAQIAIVTEVPYQQLTQGIDGGTIGTTEFREAGVTLMVTPHIANDHTIAMDINPQFSLLTGFTEGDNAPIIDRRETRTTVRIGNLQTLVLGGLRQRTRSMEKSGIPGLSKVPYLGTLFRHTRWSSRESELLVFITPELLLPDYGGTGREICVAENITGQVNATPTMPVPFGKDVLIQEKRAEKEYINSQPIFPHRRAKAVMTPATTPVVTTREVGLIGGYGSGLE